MIHAEDDRRLSTRMELNQGGETLTLCSTIVKMRGSTVPATDFALVTCPRCRAELANRTLDRLSGELLHGFMWVGGGRVVACGAPGKALLSTTKLSDVTCDRCVAAMLLPP